MCRTNTPLFFLAFFLLIINAAAVPITNNIISGTQTISNQTAPSLFAGMAPGGGNGSTYTYLWQMSETGAGSGYAAAAGINHTQDYQAGVLTIPPPPWLFGWPDDKKVWFRRIVTSGTDSDTSAAIEITIDNVNTWLGVSDSLWNNPANWKYPPGLTYYYEVLSGTPRNPVITGSATVGQLTIDSGKTVSLAGNGDSLIVNWSIEGGMFTPQYDGSKGTTVFNAEYVLHMIPPGEYNNLVINTTGTVMFFDVRVRNRIEFPGTVRLLGELIIDTNCTYSIGLVRLDNSFVGYNSKMTIRNIGTGGRTGNVHFPIESFPYGAGSVTINNAGTADNFSIRCLDSVRTDGLSGAALTTNVVGKAWVIHEGVQGGSNVTMQLHWYPFAETPGFDGAAAYIAYFNNNFWRPDTAAMVTFGTMNGHTRSGLTVFNNTVFGVASTGTLPVVLLEFDAVKREKDMLLSWSTASELNNSHFLVQRSVDGSVFETITRLTGNGTQNNRSVYQYLDKGVAGIRSGTMFYRLVQVDFDGSQTPSEILRISWQDSHTPAAITAYPNPFAGYTSVFVMQQQASCGTFSITDLNGKTVLNKTVLLNNGITEIVLDDLPAAEGILFLTLTSDEGVVTTRLMQQHK